MSIFTGYKRTISLLPSLGLIFSFLFIWSHNVHMYRGAALLCSFAAILMAALLLFFINSVCITKLLSFFKDKKKADILFCIFIACEFIFFAGGIVSYADILYKNEFLAFIVAIIIFFILWKRKGALLVFFSCTMILFSLVNLTKNTIADLKELETTSNLPPVSLKMKPNIYLFWMESHHSTDILKSTFGIDSTAFTDFLTSHGFQIKENVYSSAEHTLKAMGQLYLCNNISAAQQVGNNDVSRSTRGVIGGDQNNVVFRTLKENGYKTIFLTSGISYYFHNQGIYLDETDFNASYFFPIIDSIYMKDYESIRMKEKFLRTYLGSPNSQYQGTLSDRVKTAIAKGKEWQQPYMIAFKGIGNHTPPSGWSWKQRDEWIKSDYYQDLVRKAHEEAQGLISYILQQDPGALIILLGDHGAITYRGLEPENCEQQGVALQDFFDDHFKVFFAYRLPNDDTYDLASGMYMNNMNVFIHIFSYLAQDKSLLQYRVPSESVLEDVKMVEGKLQPSGGK